MLWVMGQRGTGIESWEEAKLGSKFGLESKTKPGLEGASWQS